MPSPIDAYLHELRRALRHDPILARRVLEEVVDHLSESVAAGREAGMSEEEAQENAVRRFGPAAQFASQFDRFVTPLRLLLVFASIATVGVAIWLFTVIAVVLPAHDPAHIPLWRTVALCFLAYSALSWAYLVLGPRHIVLRWSVLTVSIVAIACGIYGIVDTFRRAAASGDFEGYIVLMGLILCGHGLAAFVYTSISARIARQLR